jgi:hypothetical protein
MKIIILSIFMVSLLISSCTKANTTPSHPVHELEYSALAAAKEGGDDDDGPVIMELVSDVEGLPVAGAIVILTKNEDTVVAHTDDYGICISKLRVYGQWRLSITHPDYQSIDIMISVVTRESLRTDTLIR